MAVDPATAMLALNQIKDAWVAHYNIEKNPLKHKMGFWERAKLHYLAQMPIIGAPVVENYLDTKLGRQEDWQQREALRKFSTDIMNAANLKTASQQATINRQLASNVEQLNLAAAQRGSYRTGARQTAIKEMGTEATRAVAEVGAANQMQAVMAAKQYEQDFRDYNLKVAQLESAKNAGDTETMGNIASQMAQTTFFDKLFNMPAAQPKTSSSLTQAWGDISQSYQGLEYTPEMLTPEMEQSLWDYIESLDTDMGERWVE